MSRNKRGKNLERNSARLLLVSNRPPYSFKAGEGEEESSGELVRGTGGLVSALDPVMKKRGGEWFALVSRDSHRHTTRVRIKDEGNGPGYKINFLKIDRKLLDGFYLGFSNSTLWPLFHCFLGRTTFEKKHWENYLKVNIEVAKEIGKRVKAGDLVWVHDYHFLILPKLLKRIKKDISIAFFLHIPFPPPDILQAMPWAEEILEGILGADLVGFHTEGYMRNFLDSVEGLLEYRVDRSRRVIFRGERKIRCGKFPISIDYEKFQKTALSEAVQRKVKGIRDAFGVKNLGIGVDRLDYTKGVLERLMAIERLLERYRELRRNFVFIQLTVPSREKVAEYEEMKRVIDETVGRLNGKFAEGGWMPIHYYYRSFQFETLVSYYRAADVGVVTPLRDGMNLVSKEYVVSKVGLPGALVLSELTGAADELKEAFLVNPYDIDAVADAIYVALTVPDHVKRERIEKLNRRIMKNNIYRWVSEFMKEWEKVRQ
ncbi:MAG: trehalose-6-phosphate synthase [Deltaproteobacteria bacterium]|nr:MAG: trehalose-6-phosphate synthase [Deltaproteobacteria bacterium]